MALAAPKPIETASANPINVIRKYFIDPPQILVVDGTRRELMRTAEGPNSSLKQSGLAMQISAHRVFVSI